MTIVFECDRRFCWRPTLTKGRVSYRVCWAWFAIAWLRIRYEVLVVQAYEWILPGGRRITDIRDLPERA